MSSKSNRDVQPLTLKDTLEKITSFSQDEKKTYKDFLKLYMSYSKQSGIKPEDLLDLLSKGMECFSKDKYKIITSVYASIKTRSSSNENIELSILDECIKALKSLKYEISVDSIESDFNNILHRESTESGSIRIFIKDVLARNKDAGENRLLKDDVLSVIYLFLVIAVEFLIQPDSKQVSLLIETERVFIEEALSLPDKKTVNLTCTIIPHYLTKGKIEKPFGSMCYLYYDYKLKSLDLQKEVSNQREQISRLNDSLEQKEGAISSLKDSIEKMMEEKKQLSAAVQTATSEKEEAEDRLEYETNRIELQYRSQNQGLAKKYKDILGLEIDGIEDIVEYLPDDAKEAVQERVDRMRKIIAEIGGE